MKGLDKRLARVGRALAGRCRPDQFDVVEIVPVGTERTEGLPKGLHRVGPAGSTAGLLVFDPAAGEPTLPEGALAPWGVAIRCHLDEDERAA